MEPNPRQPRRFRLRLRTLLVVIAFLALLLGVVVQSVRLERERRRVAVFVDQLAAERARAEAQLRIYQAAIDRYRRFQARPAKQGSEAGSGPEILAPAARN
jgi:hypothetical protein